MKKQKFILVDVEEQKIRGGANNPKALKKEQKRVSEEGEGEVVTYKFIK